MRSASVSTRRALTTDHARRLAFRIFWTTLHSLICRLSTYLQARPKATALGLTVVAYLGGVGASRRGAEGRLWQWGNEPGSCEEFSFGCGIVSVRAGDEAATPLPEEVYHLGSNVSEWVVLVSNNCKGGDCHASWDGKSDQIAHMGSAWDIPFDRISQKKRSSRYSVDESTGFRCVFQKRSINKGG